jgi:hypothetical protein
MRFYRLGSSDNIIRFKIVNGAIDGKMKPIVETVIKNNNMDAAVFIRTYSGEISFFSALFANNVIKQFWSNMI